MAGDGGAKEEMSEGGRALARIRIGEEGADPRPKGSGCAVICDERR